MMHQALYHSWENHLKNLKFRYFLAFTITKTAKKWLELKLFDLF